MIDQEKIQEAARLIIEAIGEDAEREGLKCTPARIGRMYEEIMAGYSQDPSEILSTFFAADDDSPVIEKDITFYSMCEHHMLPYFGKAHIAYIPDGKVVGISKLARCVEIYARRLQIQEHMTAQIADCLMEVLSPKGVMVVLEAEHTCMTMRGVKKPGSRTVTIASRGIIRDDEVLQDRFLKLLTSRS
ncbi:MAG: GTP cyclohydrolase I FolE [Lachnospiraceae bacterium]|nr:GTP cyclohydrolase I FolE [Lachnospiraceae bacterium]